MLFDIVCYTLSPYDFVQTEACVLDCSPDHKFKTIFEISSYAETKFISDKPKTRKKTLIVITLL